MGGVSESTLIKNVDSFVSPGGMNGIDRGFFPTVNVSLPAYSRGPLASALTVMRTWDGDTSQLFDIDIQNRALVSIGIGIGSNCTAGGGRGTMAFVRPASYSPENPIR